MNKNQKGFSAIEALLILIIAGIVGFTGWYVWQARKNADASYSVSNSASSIKSSTATKLKTPPKASDISQATYYKFDQLGISMGILPGWNVDKNVHQQNGVNIYKWNITKSGADGNIELNSDIFVGGFESCGLIPATIDDAAPTKNPDLMFLSWSHKTYDKSQGIVHETNIVKTHDKFFKTVNDESASSVEDRTLKPGNYYYCFSYPSPGWNLSLNKEPAPGYDRIDFILANKGSNNSANFSTASKSYSDIKAMLESIE